MTFHQAYGIMSAISLNVRVLLRQLIKKRKFTLLAPDDQGGVMLRTSYAALLHPGQSEHNRCSPRLRRKVPAMSDVFVIPRLRKLPTFPRASRGADFTEIAAVALAVLEEHGDLVDYLGIPGAREILEDGRAWERANLLCRLTCEHRDLVRQPFVDVHYAEMNDLRQVAIASEAYGTLATVHKRALACHVNEATYAVVLRALKATRNYLLDLEEASQPAPRQPRGTGSVSKSSARHSRAAA